jgi:hypothetical protein
MPSRWYVKNRDFSRSRGLAQTSLTHPLSSSALWTVRDNWAVRTTNTAVRGFGELIDAQWESEAKL